MALYVVGLILLEKGQTAVRIATVLPARTHDALNRLLRVLPWSPQQLILGLIRWVQRRGDPGYLCLDDVVVEKPFAKLLPWVGWTYSHSQKRHVFGFHVVLCFWCNGSLRIPVGFRLWRPKREGMTPYRTKLELAQDLVSGVLRAGLTFEYLVFDLWYNARWFTKWLDRQQILWVSTLKSNALITSRDTAPSDSSWQQTAREVWTTSSATIAIGGERRSSSASAAAGMWKRAFGIPSSWQDWVPVSVGCLKPWSVMSRWYSSRSSSSSRPGSIHQKRWVR